MQRGRPGLRQLLDTVDGVPALVLGRRADMLAANGMASALFTDFERFPGPERNYVRWMLLDADARSLFVDWEAQARAAVQTLRLESGRDPGDRATVALVSELREESAEFGRRWQEHGVYQRSHGSKRLRHPIVGELTVGYETLTPARRRRHHAVRLHDRGRNTVPRGDGRPGELDALRAGDGRPALRRRAGRPRIPCQLRRGGMPPDDGGT